MNLDIGNCIRLKTLARELAIAGVIDDVITRFMAENFEKIVVKKEFCDTVTRDVIALFQFPGIKYSSETVKWEAALKWVKHDIQNRKKIFPELFTLIKLESLPLGFLRQAVRDETLIKESRKCSDVLIDYLFSKATKLEKEKLDLEAAHGKNAEASSRPTGRSRVTIIDQQPLEGTMTLNLSRNLPGMGGSTAVITYRFPAGQLQGISYPAENFETYLPGRWGFYPRLEKAFQTGKIFKLEYDEEELQGKIIWGDIPHKTRRVGGRKNNGYPDEGYMKRLDDALKSKGF